MEKPPTSEELDLFKWAFGALGAFAACALRWLFGDIRGTLKDHAGQFEKIRNEITDIKVLLAKISTKLEINED